MFLRGQSRCRAYSLSPRLLVRWQMGQDVFVLPPPPPFFSSPYVCVWWEGCHLFVSVEIWNHEGIAMVTWHCVGVEWSCLERENTPTLAELWSLWIKTYNYNISICLWSMDGHLCPFSHRICCRLLATDYTLQYITVQMLQSTGDTTNSFETLKRDPSRREQHYSWSKEKDSERKEYKKSLITNENYFRIFKQWDRIPNMIPDWSLWIDFIPNSDDPGLICGALIT